MNGRVATSTDVDSRLELSVDRLTGGHKTSSSSCDVTMTSSHQQQQHHRGPQPISPPPPSPQISAADLLLLTEASATHNGTFQCTLCSKQFGYKNGLIRHVRLTHVGEKPYQCSICNRRFGYKHILMEHQNLHFGNRPYACHLCDKRFAARSNLIQHRMVHRRPFSCALCTKRFDREDQLSKHLFAHPQSHAGLPAAAAARPPALQLDTDSRSPPPRDADDDKTAADNGDTPSPSKSPARPAHQLQAHPPPGTVCEPRGSAGHRIDAICSQLITSRQHTPLAADPGYTPADPGSTPASLYDHVVVKQEVEETADVNDYSHHHHHHPHHHHDDYHYVTARHHNAAAAGGDRDKPFISSHQLPCNAQSALAALTDWSSPAASRLVCGKPSLSPLTDAADKSSSSSSALPGIHEVFSKTKHKLPSFANFMPAAAVTSELTSSFQPRQSGATSGSASGVVNPTQRPTAQLPPMTHGSVRSTKDQAVQHSQSVAGFPSLDDVLSYYVSQGRLFRCQHCSILFFERGMYFLHASLHGLTSPWECSICHKVCSDKNEFTLHFVNQQHNP